MPPTMKKESKITKKIKKTNEIVGPTKVQLINRSTKPHNTAQDQQKNPQNLHHKMM